jgi:hypothetical protein
MGSGRANSDAHATPLATRAVRTSSGGPRGPPRQARRDDASASTEQGRETRRRIVSAAATPIGERGVAGTGLDDIRLLAPDADLEVLTTTTLAALRRVVLNRPCRWPSGLTGRLRSGQVAGPSGPTWVRALQPPRSHDRLMRGNSQSKEKSTLRLHRCWRLGERDGPTALPRAVIAGIMGPLMALVCLGRNVPCRWSRMRGQGCWKSMGRDQRQDRAVASWISALARSPVSWRPRNSVWSATARSHASPT